MTTKQATPYLFFNGTAEQALRLYEQTLDAKVETLLRYAEMPNDAGTCQPEDANRVMHALVHIGDARLMVSDVTADRQTERSGGSVQIVLDFEDVQDMTRKFEALAASGEVVMPLHDAFWGAKFGALEDQFGIGWMFSCLAEAD